MRTLTIVAALWAASLLFCASLRAQHIPDANFAAAIRANCPTCIDANDELTPAAANLVTLDIDGWNIADLTGISGFTNLDMLIAADNQLTVVPVLPSTITRLYLENNQITHIAAPLPPNLWQLNVANNQLTELPPLSGTMMCVAFNNRIRRFPSIAPSALITAIGLTNNEISSVPDLSEMGIIGELYLQDNPLVHIESFDTTGRMNGLRVELGNNPDLFCLPPLPQGLNLVVGSGTGITCLPNMTAAILQNQLNPMPVCASPSPCGYRTRLVGDVYWDMNGNCVQDAGDIPVADRLVWAADSLTGAFRTAGQTDAAGRYRMIVGGQDVQLLQVDTLRQPLVAGICATPSITPNGDTVEQHIGLTPRALLPYLSVQLDAQTMQPCSLSTYHVSCANSGTADAPNAQVEITFDPFLVYLGNDANINAQALGGNRYRFALGNLAAGEMLRMRVDVQVSCQSVGSYLHHYSHAHIQPDTLGAFALYGYAGALLTLRDSCANDTVFFVIENIGAAMPQASTYRLAENSQYISLPISYQLGAGQRLVVAQPAQSGRVYRLETQQLPNTPPLLGDSLLWAVNAHCHNTSQDTRFMRQFYNGHTVAYRASSFAQNLEFRRSAEVEDNRIEAENVGYGDDHCISTQEPLEYRISFRNPSAGVVDTVVILDTLDTQVFDIRSAQLINSSLEGGRLDILDGNVLRIAFYSAQLGDSLSGAAADGFATLRLWQHTQNTVGTELRNRVAIRLDTLPEVLTQQVVHRVCSDFVPTQLPISAEDLQAENGATLLLYPNPSSGDFRVEWQHAQAADVRVHDALGRVVWRADARGLHSLSVQGRDLPAVGCYFLALYGEDGERLAGAKLLYVGR